MPGVRQQGDRVSDQTKHNLGDNERRVERHADRECRAEVRRGMRVAAGPVIVPVFAVRMLFVGVIVRCCQRTSLF